jgi:hypothetical protein
MGAVPRPLRFLIKRHATRPYIELLVKNSDGTAFDFTGASEVLFSMKDQDDVLKIDSVAAEFDADDPTLGKLRYKWVKADTDTEGEFNAEFDVNYPGSETLTVPVDGDIRVKVYTDVNDA